MTSLEAFTVDVTNHCPTSAITTVAIPNKSYTTSTANLTFSFLDWTDFYSYCTPFTYTSLYSNGTALDSFITFTPLTKTFTIYTTDLSKALTYTINVVGTLPSGATASVSFQL